MPRPRFYLNPLPAGHAVLTGKEAVHAVASRRLRRGDDVVLFDGQGHEALGAVVRADRRRAEIELQEVVERPYDAPVRVTLAVALPKGLRQDQLVEQCTEIGAAAIWPMLTERSAAKPGSERLARWRRIAIESAKQSQRAWLPALEPPQTYGKVLLRTRQFDVAILCHPDGEQTPLPAVLARHASASDLLLLVGPEGGFSPEEAAATVAVGAEVARLGSTVLRVETAAAAAIAIVVAYAGARGGA